MVKLPERCGCFYFRVVVFQGFPAAVLYKKEAQGFPVDSGGRQNRVLTPDFRRLHKRAKLSREIQNRTPEGHDGAVTAHTSASF